jgi:putative metallohydrolase (TIGR04338 family)
MQDRDQLVYDGENAMRSQHGDRRFDSIADIRAYVRVLVQQDWFRRRWPQRMRFKVVDGRGSDCAYCLSSDGVAFVLCFPRAQRTEYYVLHEIGHAVTWNESHHDHGLIFRDAALVLTRQRMGRAAANLLRHEWRIRGLPVS